MIKADFHVHTEYSPDALSPIEDVVEQCVRRKMGLVAITDHNTIEGALKIREMAPFQVIVGEEITTLGGDVVGLFLTEPVPRDLPPLEAVRAIKEQGGLVLLPHPFDRFRGSAVRPDVLQEILPHVDIVEAFNSHTTLNYDNLKAEALAQERGLPMVAVTDAHHASEIGTAYTLLPDDFDLTPEGLLEALKEATLVRHRAGIIRRLAPTLARIKRGLGLKNRPQDRQDESQEGGDDDERGNP